MIAFYIAEHSIQINIRYLLSLKTTKTNMVRLNVIGPGDSHYADPSTCCYLSYPCSYCNKNFRLIQPDNNFMAGGALMREVYRNRQTGQAVEGNKVVGVCILCSVDMLNRNRDRFQIDNDIRYLTSRTSIICSRFSKLDIFQRQSQCI